MGGPGSKIALALEHVARAARIIPHEPRWPSGGARNLDFSDAEHRCRQAVSAAWLLTHPDVNGWFLRTGVTESWIEITGVDLLIDNGQIVLEHGRTGEFMVEPEFIVYVSMKQAYAFTMEDADHD